MKLFDIKLPKTFMGEFEVTLNYPLHITDNIYALKEHGKRVLLEMIDLHPKLILAYSGGSDSAFILCCIRDLIDERKITNDAIEIVQGIFTGGDVILTADHERATKFANSLNFSPRIYKYDVNVMWEDIEKFTLDNNLSSSGCVNTSCQYILATKQDGVVIQHQGPGLGPGQGLPGRYTGLCLKNENLIFSNNWCRWDSIDNIINFDTWDKEIYSSFITPFRLSSRPINMQPYDVALTQNIEKQSLFGMGNYLYKWMLYVQCYPEMTEIFGKFVTIDWNLLPQKFFNGRIARFLQTLETSQENFAYVKLPNGNLYTKKDLTNFGDYFNV
jgi:hypothetical protein